MGRREQQAHPVGPPRSPVRSLARAPVGGEPFEGFEPRAM